MTRVRWFLSKVLGWGRFETRDRTRSAIVHLLARGNGRWLCTVHLREAFAKQGVRAWNLYPLLRELEGDGLLESRTEAGRPERGQIDRFYRCTPAGERASSKARLATAPAAAS